MSTRMTPETGAFISALAPTHTEIDQAIHIVNRLLTTWQRYDDPVVKNDMGEYWRHRTLYNALVTAHSVLTYYWTRVKNEDEAA